MIFFLRYKGCRVVDRLIETSTMLEKKNNKITRVERVFFKIDN